MGGLRIVWLISNLSSVIGIFFLIFLLIFPFEVHAYIDPGMGSIATQVILGTVFSALYCTKSVLLKTLGILKKLVSKIRHKN